MASITHKQFEAQVQQRKNAIKWRKLQDGTIYTIVSVDFINTQYGEACILTLSDGTKVLAPRALMNLLKRENKPFPRYVRINGLKKNPAKTYFAFDLV